MAVSWIRLLVAGLSLRRHSFDPRSVHVRFVVEKVALGRTLLSVLRSFPVSIIPQWLQTHHLHAALTGRAKGESLGTFQKAVFFGKSDSIG